MRKICNPHLLFNIYFDLNTSLEKMPSFITFHNPSKANPHFGSLFSLP